MICEDTRGAAAGGASHRSIKYKASSPASLEGVFLETERTLTARSGENS